MSTPHIDVRYVAGLARIELSEQETHDFQQQLSQILQYVEELRAVNVEDVDPTAHANAIFNVFRDDEAKPSFVPSDALANAPRQASDLFLVPKVIE